MAKITIKPWEPGDPGFKKVSLARLLKDKGGVSLTSAKKSIDGLLDGRSVTLETDTTDGALRLAEEITALGAVCDVTPSQTEEGD